LDFIISPIGDFASHVVTNLLLGSILGRLDAILCEICRNLGHDLHLFFLL
jgi:hypothetical protein